MAAESSDTAADLFRALWGTRAKLTEVLRWPPDMFAFTSALFRATGCYRESVSRGGVLGRSVMRTSQLQADASAWERALQEQLLGHSGRIQFDAELEHAFARLITAAEKTTVSGIATSGTREDAVVDATSRFLSDVCDWHARADAACGGYGLCTYSTSAVPKCLAELLLTARGSMSTMPKQFGAVLPKMHTPQSGLSLRSFSHHLAFASGEVEVAWRTFPWADSRQDVLNVLALPWPMTIAETQFSSGDLNQAVRTFDYQLSDPQQTAATVERYPKNRDPVVEEICRRVVQATRSAGRVHLVILPELALSHRQLNVLLTRLAMTPEARTGMHLPMILAGVQRPGSAGERSRQTGASPSNEVHLAAFFAGRWYRLTQRKHHRWRLDRSQITQYELQGRLPPALLHFERMNIAQRRLSILAPAGWLALCPLICEDLAQLEPVSEVLRSVGPNLLFAILLDGPQLRERWSARYASVLADDPGTSVLTLTAAGMVKRSQPVSSGAGASKSQVNANVDGQLAVGLWRDAATGWREIRLPPGHDAVLMTLSPVRREEFTADGRSDHGTAALITLDGYVTFGRDNTITIGRSSGTQAPVRRWDDLRELASAVHALDSALELGEQPTEVVSHLVLGLAQREATRKQYLTSLPAYLRRIVELLWSAQSHPAEHGIAALEVNGRVWGSTELRAAVAAMRRITRKLRRQYVKPTQPDDLFRLLTLYRALVDEVLQPLPSLTRTRDQQARQTRSSKWATNTALPSVILSLVYARLQNFREDGRYEARASGPVLMEDVRRLTVQIEQAFFVERPRVGRSTVTSNREGFQNR